jgi:hypothetical protein
MTMSLLSSECGFKVGRMLAPDTTASDATASEKAKATAPHVSDLQNELNMAV